MKSTRKRVLITGGAGFIGSHLVDRLIKEHYQVIVIDDLSRGKLENINKSADFIKLDIASDKLAKVVKKINAKVIFHLAAQSSVEKSLKNPRQDLNINFMATQRFLDAIIAAKSQKLIFASSAAVYKPTDKLPVSEEGSKEPISFYGLAKLCCEYLLRNYYQAHRLPYISLRFSNVYGPRQDTSSEGGVIAIFIDKILKNQKANIFGDGKQTRDFIYISDVISACFISLKKNLTGEFNISTGKQTTITDLYETLVKIAGIKSLREFHRLRYPEAKKSALSWKKFNKITGWSSQVQLEGGLKNTFNFFKNL